MKIATWNINSVRARIDQVKEWLQVNEPAVLCLQETKVQDHDFPRETFSSLGYESFIYGQKSYNGVSIHVKGLVAEDVRYGLPEPWANDQKRVISLRCCGMRIVNVYVPNGESPESEKFPFKLDFLHCLKDYLESLLIKEKFIVVLGDFNIAPEDIDLREPDENRGKIMFHPNEHAALESILTQGFNDALRLHTQEGGLYSFWDYRMNAFRRDLGWRIDLILLSSPLAPRCSSCAIDRAPRGNVQPSDHTPVIAEIDI